jgi:hypothetical protein
LKLKLCKIFSFISVQFRRGIVGCKNSLADFAFGKNVFQEETKQPIQKMNVDFPIQFRWGSTATVVTAALSSLLAISLFNAELANAIINRTFQVVGIAVVISYVVLTVSWIRLHLLKLLLKWRGWAYIPRSAIARFYLGNSLYQSIKIEVFQVWLEY